VKELIFSILLFFNPLHLFSQQEEMTHCLSDHEPVLEYIPSYLQPWWGTVRKHHLVVVFVDFPDGRWEDEYGVLKQPYTNEQLALVLNKDAAGEAGVIKNANNQLEIKALKYDYYDRWDMLFDSTNTYIGEANPDFQSHGDIAYGSMKQYWKDASNAKFDLIPYQTRTPNINIDHKLWRGIINDYELVNGVPVIKNIMLPKNKYGIDPANSYFRSYDQNDSTIADIGQLIRADAINLVTSMGFNVQNFVDNGGVFLVVFSGGHKFFKGVGVRNPFFGGSLCIRGKTAQIQDFANSKIDGFGILAHEYGHLAFGWTSHRDFEASSASCIVSLPPYRRFNID